MAALLSDMKRLLRRSGDVDFADQGIWWDVIFFYFLGEKLPSRVAKVLAVASSQLLFWTLHSIYVSTKISGNFGIMEAPLVLPVEKTSAIILWMFSSPQITVLSRITAWGDYYFFWTIGKNYSREGGIISKIACWKSCHTCKYFVLLSEHDFNLVSLTKIFSVNILDVIYIVSDQSVLLDQKHKILDLSTELFRGLAQGLTLETSAFNLFTVANLP